MMGKSPAFQLYASDFYTDTVSWTATQVGVYFRLLMHEWINGPLPVSMAKLSRIAGCDVRNMQKMWSAEIAKKFTTDNTGMYVNLRLESTRNDQAEYREKLANSGRLGGLTTQGLKRDKQSKASSKASSKIKALQSSSSPSPSNKEINNKKIYLEFVFLAEEEHQKLVVQFGEKGAAERIDRLNIYLGSTGKKYKSHYYTILNWERRNGDGSIGGNIEKGRIEGGGVQQPGKYYGIGSSIEND